MMRLSKIRAAYIAGIVDGEGSIFVSRVRNKNAKSRYVYRSGVSVSSTSFPLLFWLKLVTGIGTINKKSKRKGHKQAWTYQTWSDAASQLLVQLLPYMLLKSKQATNQIEFQNGMTWHGSHGAPKTELLRREKHAKISYALNKRGD